MFIDLEQLGFLGVFIAGAIPWFEAIAVVPFGILVGLNPWLTVLFAVLGNAATIFLFAFLGHRIRAWMLERRLKAGKQGESKRFIKAQQSFDKWGIYGMAALGPVVIGTQFAAAISVAAGVKPMKTSILISLATLLWASAIAIGMVLLGISSGNDPYP
jgi:uncharacterized membrane protein